MFNHIREVTGKSVMGTVKVSKGINNFKKRVVARTFYVIISKWQAFSTRY